MGVFTDNLLEVQTQKIGDLTAFGRGRINPRRSKAHPVERMDKMQKKIMPSVVLPTILGMICLISFPLTREAGLLAALISIKYAESVAIDTRISIVSVWLSILFWLILIFGSLLGFATGIMCTLWTTKY